MKTIKLLLLITMGMAMNACSSMYVCYVNCYGSEPQNKTYYVKESDKTDLDGDYNLYKKTICNSLDDIGYNEVSEKEADLVIDINYEVGETDNNEKEKLTEISLEGGGSAEAKVMSPINVNYPGVPKKYDVPIECKILVINNRNREEVWSMKIVDVINYESGKKEKPTFRSVMPWIIFTAKKYYGKEGTFIAKESKRKGEKVGLTWPY